MYRAALTYHPDIATFAPANQVRSGAWRVASVWVGDTHIFVTRPVADPLTPHLVMPVTRPLRRGTYVNPTKLLREVLAVRRSAS